MKPFSTGDRVIYVTRASNVDFLDDIKNIPTIVEDVRFDRSYKSGQAIKIPLHHDYIDSHYFKKIGLVERAQHPIVQAIAGAVVYVGVWLA